MLSIILSAAVAASPCLAPAKKPAHKRKHKTPVACIVPAPAPLIMPWPVVPEDLQPIPVPHVYERMPEPQPSVPTAAQATPYSYAPEPWIPFPEFGGFGGGPISVNVSVNRYSYSIVGPVTSYSYSSSVSNVSSVVTISSVDNSHNTNVYLAPSSHEAPELDAGSAAAFLTMLACGLAVIKGSKRT